MPYEYGDSPQCAASGGWVKRWCGFDLDRPIPECRHRDTAGRPPCRRERERHAQVVWLHIIVVDAEFAVAVGHDVRVHVGMRVRLLDHVQVDRLTWRPAF